jgi:hypothetical protein
VRAKEGCMKDITDSATGNPVMQTKSRFFSAQ